MRQCLKANSAEFCNGETPWEHNVSLLFLDKIELKFADRNQFQAFNWSKNNFGDLLTYPKGYRLGDS